MRVSTHIDSSVDEIVSNQVLEHEFNLVCAEIEKLSSQRQKVPEELEDLKNSYQIKMNMLVAMVQTGALTMEKYVSQVEESIEWTKKMALSFKKAGRIDEARKAMIRVKLMTQEVEETRQADQ